MRKRLLSFEEHAELSRRGLTEELNDEDLMELGDEELDDEEMDDDTDDERDQYGRPDEDDEDTAEEEPTAATPVPPITSDDEDEVPAAKYDAAGKDLDEYLMDVSEFFHDELGYNGRVNNNELLLENPEDATEIRLNVLPGGKMFTIKAYADGLMKYNAEYVTQKMSDPVWLKSQIQNAIMKVS